MSGFPYIPGLPPPPPPPKRKVFISFFQGDRAEADQFIFQWSMVNQVFIPKALGTYNNEDFVDSNNPEYVMQQIRQKYLGDSSVTIVLLGKCTHSRRYVDWELKASLRRGDFTPNGLLAILLPSVGPVGAHLPPRFAANWENRELNCYSRYRYWPTSAGDLRMWVEDAYAARTSRAHLIQNSAAMMRNNAQCRVCGLTHPA